MADPTFQSAVIYVSRSDLSSVFKTQLKEIGVENCLTVEGLENAVETLLRHEDALLVLDWGIGAAKAIAVLESISSPVRADVRPIFLFSSSEQKGLDGVAMEYSVTKIHSGDMSPKVIKDHLVDLMKVELMPTEVRDQIRVVADSRRRDDWEAAGRLLEELYEKHKDIPRVVIEYAENLFHLDTCADARTALEPLTETDKPDSRALNLLGRIHLKEGNHEKASVVLQKAKLINPYNIDRLINLGDAYLAINKVERAKANFEEALEHGSEDKRAVEGMSKSLLMGDQVNEALVFLKQLSGAREMASVFNTAAVLSMHNGRFSEGMKLYKVALETIDGEKAVMGKLGFNMGIGFHRQGDLSRAKHCFALAAAIDPKNEKARTNFEALKRSGGDVVIPDDMGDKIEALKNLWVEGESAARDVLGESDHSEEEDVC